MNYNIMTPEEAATLIQDGDTISFSGFSSTGTPRVVTEALAKRAEAEHAAGRPFKVSLFTGAITSDKLDDALANAHAVDRRMPFNGSPVMRKAINSGEVNYLDMHLSLVGQYVRYGFLGKVNWCIIGAIEVSDLGEITLAGCVGCVDTYAHAADKIIIEINSAYDHRIRGIHDIYTVSDPPRRDVIPIYKPSDRIGSPTLKVDPKKIAAVVPCHYRYNVPPFAPLDEITTKLGRNVVDFLSNEIRIGHLLSSTLPIQSGMGNVSNAVLEALKDAPDIPPFTLYTEVLQDKGIDLIDLGRCTFASTGSLYLSDEYYDKLMNNIDFYKDHIILRPYELSNNPEIVRRLGVISINTALEVDIFGNVNSTHVLGSNMMNGIGGSADFARSAYMSIFICPSIAKKGAISAIVPYVTHVDSSEHSVMLVVTEQGVADLRGKSPRQRAETIIENCAHPSYRPLLRKYFELALKEGGHTPMSLDHCFDFHKEFRKSGDMHNTTFD